MDWLASLCLSLPLGGALAYSAWRLARSIERASAARNWIDAAADVTTHLNECAATVADAIVKSARYTSGFTKPKVKRTEEDDDPHPFDLWMADGGSSKDEKVQWRVEWALNRLRGEDTEQGDVAKAEKILAEDAPGYLASMRRWINRQARRKG